MNYLAAMEKVEYSRIDKLNLLTNIDTFWDSVRKLSRNCNSDHGIRSWHRLAEIRYSELKVQISKDYIALRDYLTSELDEHTMELVMAWINDAGSLPVNEMSSSEIELARRMKEIKFICDRHRRV